MEGHRARPSHPHSTQSSGHQPADQRVPLASLQDSQRGPGDQTPLRGCRCPAWGGCLARAAHGAVAGAAAPGVGGERGLPGRPDLHVTWDTASVLGWWLPTLPFFYKSRTPAGAVVRRRGDWFQTPEDGTARGPGGARLRGTAVRAQPSARRAANSISAFRNFLGFFTPNSFHVRLAESTDAADVEGWGRAGDAQLSWLPSPPAQQAALCAELCRHGPCHPPDDARSRRAPSPPH